MSSVPPGPLRRVGVISLGCSKNLVDTEVMLGHLDRAGYELVQDPEQAEMVVINTCGFIEAAREESIQTILEVAERKKSGGLRRLVVAGCMVQRYGDELRANLPEVDDWIGLDELHRIVGGAGGPEAPAPAGPLENSLPVLSSAPATAPEARPPARPPAARYLYDDRTPRRLATPRWTAFVKIAEGCDHTCSFCAIPSFRGTFRSRRPESVVSEAASLARGGVREINLIAQDSSHYGRDLGLREGLAGLLERLDAVEPLRWIRVHYLYPNTVTDHLIATMARLSRVVPYVDMPLQHSHPDTLRRMRRGGSGDRHLEILGRFRAAMPGAALRTTLIVGFPGETEREFHHLLDFVEAARFDHLGAFQYSHEEGTGAASEHDDVAPEVKERRMAELMELQRRLVAERNERRIGEIAEVVVEGPHPETEHLLVGRTALQAPDVDGQVWINDGVAEPGRFVRVEFTESAGYDLIGRILGPA